MNDIDTGRTLVEDENGKSIGFINLTTGAVYRLGPKIKQMHPEKVLPGGKVSRNKTYYRILRCAVEMGLIKDERNDV